MKKYLLPALGGALVLALVLALVFTSLPVLTGAGADARTLDGDEGQASETALAPAEGVAVVAEGRVLPVEHATLSMAASGIVDEILVEEDADVRAGEVILRLRDAHQQAAVAEAEAALASAQAQFDALAAGPRAQQVTAAQASLDAARAGLRQAQAAYDRVAGRRDVAKLPKSLQLEQATNAHTAAKARYDALFAEPDADPVAGVQAQVKEALANLERLREPATAPQIAEAQAMVRQAQAQLGLLLAGAREEELAAAAAAVDQARAGLERAQASLADTELRAPFGGTVAVLDVRQGEQVVAGTPLAQLADLAAWQVETEDLTELDVVGVHPGDQATVTFDAIPGLSLPGTVVRIQPLGQEKLGDITYTVLVQLDEQDARLLWNMTALVSIP